MFIYHSPPQNINYDSPALVVNYSINKEIKMKDIKSYIIGFLTCACLFLIMGQTKSDSQIGRYQTISGNKYEYFYLLDTETGAVENHIENPENTYKKRLANV